MPRERDCVDIVSTSAEPTRNFYRVRFRNPKLFVGGKYSTPQWGQRAAMTIGTKYYGVSGCKITMAQPVGGRWMIQNVLIPKHGGVEMTEELALQIANHIQDRIEREGQWSAVLCRDNETKRYVSQINGQHIVRDGRGRFAPHAAEEFGAESPIVAFRYKDDSPAHVCSGRGYTNTTRCGQNVNWDRIHYPYHLNESRIVETLDSVDNKGMITFGPSARKRICLRCYRSAAQDFDAEEFGAESFRVGDEGMFEGGEVRITSIEDNSEDGRQNVYFFTYLDEEGNSDGFTHTSGERRFLNQFSMFPRDWNAEEFEAEDYGKGNTSSGHVVMWDGDSFNMTFLKPIDGYTNISGYWDGDGDETAFSFTLDVQDIEDKSIDLYVYDVMPHGVFLDDMVVGGGKSLSPQVLEAVKEGLEWMLNDYSGEHEAEEFEAQRIQYDYVVHREPRGTEVDDEGNRIPNPRGGWFTSAPNRRDAENFDAEQVQFDVLKGKPSEGGSDYGEYISIHDSYDEAQEVAKRIRKNLADDEEVYIIKEVFDDETFDSISSKKLMSVGKANKAQYLSAEEFESPTSGGFNRAKQFYDTCSSQAFTVLGRKLYYRCSHIGTFTGASSAFNKGGLNTYSGGQRGLRTATNFSDFPIMNSMAEISQQMKPSDINDWKEVISATNQIMASNRPKRKRRD